MWVSNRPLMNSNCKYCDPDLLPISHNQPCDPIISQNGSCEKEEVDVQNGKQVDEEEQELDELFDRKRVILRSLSDEINKLKQLCLEESVSC